MSDFDPNTEPETQEQADAYINWCAENFMRLSQGAKRTYRTAARCAHWLLVVAFAQLHLDDAVQENREGMLEQLVNYQRLARSLERQQQRYAIERLIVLRATVDCWEPVGAWSERLLIAAKCAVSAMLLIEVHPLIDLWELPCPDVWSLLEEGRSVLAEINQADELSFEDYAIKPAEMTIAKFTWQKINNQVRHMGLPPLSQN